MQNLIGNESAIQQLAAVVKTKRHDLGLSQLDLSYKLNLTANSLISRVESGDYVPKAQTAFRISDALQIPKAHMLDLLIEIAKEGILEEMREAPKGKVA